MNYIVSGISNAGNVRTTNQDNYYCEGKYRSLEQEEAAFEDVITGRRYWIAALFDGMGGEKNGEIAALIASLKTKEACEGKDNPVDIGRLIETINKSVCNEMYERKCRMGSTCVFLEFDNNRCRSLNVGDSRAYLFHNGVLTQLTQDHTEAASYSSFFGTDNSFLRGSENRLTQHLGVPEDDFIIEPFVSDWVEMQAGDILLLCSDGLTHVAGDEMITRVLSNGVKLADKKVQLLSLSLEGGGLDNTTIILIEACE